MNLIRHGRARAKRAEGTSRQNQLRHATALALAGSLVAVLLLALASPASAKPVTPHKGEGLISMTQRTCGSAATWQAEAARNKVSSANGYRIYLGSSYDITCVGRGDEPQFDAGNARPKPPQASRSGRSDNWVHPLASGVRASNWKACPGAPRDGHTHVGIDLSAGTGSAVRAVWGGQVIVSHYSGSAGWYVKIAHGGATTSTYMHLRSRGLPVGTGVAPGTVIGYSGATGNAKGPHLHFEATGAGNTAQTVKAHGLNLGC